MSKDRDMKKDSVYIKEINDKQDEINKLRNERDSLVIKYFLMEQKLGKYETIISQLQDYIHYFANEPTYKSYGGTLQEILQILEGKYDD